MCDEATIRRRRRRRRRKRTALKRIYSDDDDEDDGLVSVNKKVGKSRFMTAKEEARFSWYLKVYTYTILTL